MNRAACLIVFVTSLVFNTNPVYAEGLIANTSPAIERPVVKIATVSKNNLSFSIPGTALTIRNGISGVFVLENNEARFRMVRLGKTGTGKVEILSGLFGNETLVVGGLEAVHDGSPITVLIKKSTVKK